VFPIAGWHFESRIVMVSTGEIGGIYSVDVAPAGGLHFLLNGDESVLNATPEGEPVRVRGQTLSGGWNAGTAEQAAPAFVRLLVSSLIPTAARASLGINLASMTSERIRSLGFKLPKNAKGVLVAGIEPNSRASASGLQLGDIIEQVNGRTVQSPEEVVAARGDVTDQPITLTVNRGGKTISITVPAP
jgi:S1-C subfamily serine protease